MVDIETYNYLYEHLISKDLVISFSSELNLLGDIIGKIIGFAKKAGTYILMMNRRLMRYARETIPVLEVPARAIIEDKQNFFRKLIPGLESARGIRWFIGFTVEILNPIYPQLTPIGIMLQVFDP